jgi:hypothetical protein
LPWKELSSRWQKLLCDLSSILGDQPAHPVHLGTEEIEPLWFEIGRFMRDRKVSAKLFFGFLKELFSGSARKPHPGADHRYAPVIVTTARKAFGCSWDVCLISDSTISEWPQQGIRNPLLDDRWRMCLRDEGFVLPTTSDRRQSEIDLYLQLIHQTRFRAILTCLEQDEKGDEMVANDLVTFCRRALKPVELRFEQQREVSRQLDLNRFAAIWQKRQNSTLPFDEWFLDFSRARLKIEPWSPSMLERAFKAPATFAYRKLFGCEREWNKHPVRDARRTIGNLVHTLMSSAFADRREIERVTARLGISNDRESILDAFRRHLKRAWETERTALPSSIRNLWWESVFDQALMVANLVGEHLAEHLNKDLWLATERIVKGACKGDGYELDLEGRTDLIVLDRPDYERAVIGVFDFKTGKSPQLVRLDAGEGLQFFAYQLLLEGAGAAEVSVYQSRIDETRCMDFGPRQAANRVLSRLSAMQQNFSFGQMPEPLSEYEVCEVLPISSLIYSPELLAAKRALTEKLLRKNASSNG